MKKKGVFWQGFILFNLVAFLIAARDVLTQIFTGKTHLISIGNLLLIFCLSSLFSSGILIAFNKPKNTIKKLKSAFQSKTFIQNFLALGILSFVCFAMTIFGIKYMGAPVFSLIEYAMLPFFTLSVAVIFYNSQIFKSHWVATLIMIIGLYFISISGKPDILVGPSHNNIDYWLIGSVFAIISSVITASSILFQKVLVDQNFSPIEVVFLRFIIPSILIAGICFQDLPQLLNASNLPYYGIGALGFCLPLLLMCSGFVRSEISRFAPYSIMIAIYTIILSLILIPEDREHLLSSTNLLGLSIILLGYFIFEYSEFRKIK